MTHRLAATARSLRRIAPTASCSGCLLLGSFTYAQTYLDPGDALHAINSETALQLYPVGGNVYLLADPAGGTNITVSVGDEGVLLVDGGVAENAEEALTLVRRLSSETIRYVLNTTGLLDYAGGNDVLSGAGVGYAAAANPDISRANGIAHENAMLMMVRSEGLVTELGFPNLTFFTDHQPIYFNGETIELLHQPRANTNSESIVFFRKSDVVSTGPIFLTTTYPEIYAEQQGTFGGVVDALNTVIAITNTRKNQEGGTMVVPGRGRVADEADVVEYRDMLVIIRDRVAALMADRRSLADVQAAAVSFDYDRRYATPEWTAEQFVEAVFDSLAATTAR